MKRLLNPTQWKSRPVPWIAFLILLTACTQTPPAPTDPPADSPAPATATSPPRETPPPTVLPTQTSAPTPTTHPGEAHASHAEHDPTQWHPLTQEYGHHHGVNPADYVAVFGEPLQNYLDTYGSISYPWRTPNENDETGFGHHNGYIWLYDQAREGCELFNNGNFPPDVALASINCITDVLVQLHTDGTQAHMRKRFHSHYAFFRICDQATLTRCGVVASGGWADYGILQAPYKVSHCPIVEFDPEPLPPSLDPPPYRASHVEVRGNEIVQFWSGLRAGSINAAAYPHDPNAFFGIAWSSLDAWGPINAEDCANPARDTFVGGDFNNSAFQIFTVMVYDVPSAPFTGFTDQWGHVLASCPDLNDPLACIPLVISEGTPLGPASLNRSVDNGNPEAAPILEFDNGLGWIRLPEH